MKKYVKMSKSRGNGISVDAIVKGVYNLDSRYEFRSTSGCLVDWTRKHIYFQENRGYLTLRGQVVFLHEKDNPVPAFLTTLTTVQHENELNFWLNLLRKEPAMQLVNLDTLEIREVSPDQPIEEGFRIAFEVTTEEWLQFVTSVKEKLR